MNINPSSTRFCTSITLESFKISAYSEQNQNVSTLLAQDVGGAGEVPKVQRATAAAAILAPFGELMCYCSCTK